MARQPSNRPDADEPDSELDAERPNNAPDQDPNADESGHLETEAAADSVADRSLWEELRITPVEIALPSGAGFTLRAYRMSDQVTATDIEERETDDPFAARRRAALADAETEQLDDQFTEELAEAEVEADERRGARGDRDAADLDVDRDEPDPADFEDEPETDVDAEQVPEPEPEEVPVFLSHRGRLLLFKSPESLVSFIRSGAPNDMTQVDTWDQLVDRVEPADIVPSDEDSYELDLVVENLRGGHDTWDANLLIKAGEAARDLSYALRLPSVLDMLSTGSSLDDLDEALRSTVKGGLGGFRGRRRVRKIGAQTASLGWRTIIGKISAVVDWRD
ncbi:DNA primase [Plantactinospora sp. GCM10030261]|uniref:DNA primase n=1 Tax=Plantactinospora sp. GCM10030261 TaxID=3273420 RepID=UPI0036110CB6